MRSFRFAGLAATITFTWLLSAGADLAHAQRSDAIQSADFAARTAVQTIYHNLITEGYEWRWIRDEKMPEILYRAVRTIRRQSQSMDKSLILGTFVPTYISAFYDEIAKLNAQHQVRCLDVSFVVTTMIGFFGECRSELSEFAPLSEIAGPILRAEFTFKICQTLSYCQEALSDKFFIEFDTRRPQQDFYNVCIGNEL